MGIRISSISILLQLKEKSGKQRQSNYIHSDVLSKWNGVVLFNGLQQRLQKRCQYQIYIIFDSFFVIIVKGTGFYTQDPSFPQCFSIFAHFLSSPSFPPTIFAILASRFLLLPSNLVFPPKGRQYSYGICCFLFSCPKIFGFEEIYA